MIIYVCKRNRVVPHIKPPCRLACATFWLDCNGNYVTANMTTQCPQPQRQALRPRELSDTPTPRAFLCERTNLNQNHPMAMFLYCNGDL